MEEKIMSKFEYSLNLLKEELELLQGNVNRMNDPDVVVYYYTDEDTKRWMKDIEEVKSHMESPTTV
jgi:hypothetical protein